MGGYVHGHSNVQMKVSPRSRGGGYVHGHSNVQMKVSPRSRGGGYVHGHSNVQMKVSPRARGGGLCTQAQQCSDEGQSKGTGWGVMYTGTAMFR